MINEKRIRKLNQRDLKRGPVLYWMSRDQRMNDNWGLLYAQELALEMKQPLLVLFCLVPVFQKSAWSSYAFMLEGLKETEKQLSGKRIPFLLLTGDPVRTLSSFAKKHNAGAVVCDQDPLRIKRRWREQIAEELAAPLFEVDSHNIVPVWAASAKQEYGAYTLRPRLHALLPEFLEEFPLLRIHPHAWQYKSRAADWEKAGRTIHAGRRFSQKSPVRPGARAALKMTKDFLLRKLSPYHLDKNDPNRNGTSLLSPFLHFGQISAQRVVLETGKAVSSRKGREAFLEELIVRRELADNYCFYNPHYDSILGFPPWAIRSLDRHKKDKRPYLYSPAQFENAKTHDPLWNAAQLEMVKTGRMHGYMRMYWAKKILEWTASAEEAMSIAIALNDRYELDGRDPNGYAGIAWSIGGVHDRPWFDRPVFGQIRFMSENGCRAKFNADQYIDKIKNT